MGLIENILASVPLWIAAILLFVLLTLCCRLGTLLRRWLRDTDHSDESHLLAAALALLGLLIAFTFSLAVNRFDARRELVVREASAIGTAWLRAGLAEDAAGRGLQQAIAAYADLRLQLTNAGNADRVEAETRRTQAALWSRVRQATPAMQPPLAATLVTATNEMFDSASARKAEREARIPARVLDILLLYTLMAAGIVGYVLGVSGPRHRVVTSILFLLLTLALTLILDLDRPWSGGITVSQQPMRDMRASLYP